MKYIISVFLLLLLETNIYAQSETLRVNGCGITRNAFSSELTKAFNQKYNIPTTINKKGNVIVALKALSENKADVATGCRLPLKNTITNEKDVWSVQVAWGALAFIVNENNPIENITITQLKKVLLGEIRNWKELGGDNIPINLYLRKGKNTGVGFSTRVLVFNDNKKSFSKNATRANNSTQIRKLIKTDKHSFAIDDITSIRNTPGIKVLKIDGFSPTKENILAEKYNFGRPFYLYSQGRPKGVVRKYIKYTLSNEGQQLIADLGNLNLKEGKSSKKLNFLLMMLNP